MKTFERDIWNSFQYANTNEIQFAQVYNALQAEGFDNPTKVFNLVKNPDKWIQFLIKIR